MQNNYYMLRQVAARLNTILPGYSLATCFSQQKDELVLGFTNGQTDFYINAVLRSDFTCLQFPDTYHRSRKNSADLFTPALGRPITAVRQYQHERCFGLLLEGGLQLLFKMYGLKSNVLLIENGQPTLLFKNKLKNDEALNPAALDRQLAQTEAAFTEANGQLRVVFPTFDGTIKQYLSAQGYSPDLPLAQQWAHLSHTLQQLQHPTYAIGYHNHEPYLTLLPTANTTPLPTDPLQAMNTFYKAYTHHYYLWREQHQATRLLDKKLKQGRQYIAKTMARYETLLDEMQYEQWANIIMANLHHINAGQKQATLHNFYTDQEITIKLKATLSPQKNAAVYYRKAKNQKVEHDKLAENIEAREAQQEQLTAHRQAIAQFDDIKTLRKYLKDNNLTPKQEAEAESLPYHPWMLEGHAIWVGKNAKNNDVLTLKYAHKEDLWLHAKDVAGSHVIIKRQPGKPVPGTVKEGAAQLAAWYSKRKNDSLCPVTCTRRKFVRKTRHLPPGAMLVDKEEEVLLVAPGLPGQAERTNSK